MIRALNRRQAVGLLVLFLLISATVTATALAISFGVRLAAEEEPEAPTYYDQKCAAFHLENSTDSRGQAIFIGDSITDGYRLDDHYTALPFATYNRGISGDTTAGVLARLEVSVFALAPARVVLMIGTNDVDWGVPPEETVANYRAIVRAIRERLPEAMLYCMSVIPQNDTVENYGLDHKRNTAAIRALNAEILTIAEAEGGQYIDLFTPLTDESGYLDHAYSGDGLHLNTEGYRIWTSVLLPYLK